MIWRRRKPAGANPSELMPPEGVPLVLPIAGLGARLAAQITDIALTATAMIASLILLLASGLATPQTGLAVGALIFFIIRVPYYVLAELIWNGQTLGKRFMSIKVVAEDGGALTTHALVLRNLMKEAEIFLPGTLLVTLDSATPIQSSIAFLWILGVLAVPLTNPKRMRLGDIMAGTYVINLPKPMLLSDVSSQSSVVEARKDGFTFLAYQLDHYGTYELQTLEQVLRAGQRQMKPVEYENHKQTLATIVEKVRNKIGFADPVAPEKHDAFLEAFYNAQRAHLEQRQLFGDRRADKHHGTDAQQQ